MKKSICACMGIMLMICFSCDYDRAPIIEKEAYLFFKNNEDIINNAICEKIFGTVDEETNKTRTKLLGGNNEELYVWALCKNITDKNGIEGITSLPIKISYSKSAIISIDSPRDGDLYSEDLKRLFPKTVNSYYLNDRDKLNKIVEELEIRSFKVEK